MHFLAGSSSYTPAFHLPDALAHGCILLTTNLDCCSSAFSSPKSHLCLQEPNTPQSQHFTLPKTHSTTSSKPAHSLARICRGNVRFPAWRRWLIAIRKTLSECNGGKKSKCRKASLLAVGAGCQGSITAIALKSAGLWRSMLLRTRHHKLKRNSRLNIPSRTQGLPAPMHRAGLPLGR